MTEVPARNDQQQNCCKGVGLVRVRGLILIFTDVLIDLSALARSTHIIECSVLEFPNS